MRALFLANVLFAVASCQRPAQTELTGPPSPAVQLGATSAPSAPGDGAQPDTTPRLTNNPDGTIRLEVVDRWGTKVDATYENLTYLERALPTVSRGLNEAQTAQLNRAVQLQRPH